MNEAPDFDERKLWHLIDVKEFKKAIVFLEDGSITTEHKTAAVNFKDGSNRTTLMRATYHHAEVKLIKRLCEIGGKEFIMATDGDGYNALQRNALHVACLHAQPNLEVIKIVIAGGGFKLLLQQDKDGNTPLHLACEASYGGCDT